VGDERASAADLAALRGAVLGCLDGVFGTLPGRRTLRVWRRLRRRHLSWLLAPWLVVGTAHALLPGTWRRFHDGHVRAAGLYRQLSGKDPHVARAEVWRMVEQLGWLDERHPGPDEERPGAPPSADRAELEAAAGALVGYYLAGRRTDDELLGEVQAAWDEYEDLNQRLQPLERGRRGRRGGEPEFDLRERAACDRYLVAWRRWLDRHAPRASSTGLGGP
jgi:hypothetical protein